MTISVDALMSHTDRDHLFVHDQIVTEAKNERHQQTILTVIRHPVKYLSAGRESCCVSQHMNRIDQNKTCNYTSQI